jgi:hypothetical protein
MPGRFRKITKRKFTRKKNAQHKKTTVAKIAKQVVHKELKKKTELKFFDSNEFRDLNPVAVVGSKISVFGFSSTDIVQPDGGAYQYPTGTNMTPLKCLQPFKSSSSDTQFRRYLLDGRECNPITAQAKFVLRRDVAKNENSLNASPPPTQGLGDNIMNNFPVICRVISVIPKLASSINTECDPAKDLFLNRYGSPCGVDTLDVDNIDVLVHPVNKRRYIVQQDFKMKLQNPFAVSWTANNADEDRPYLVQTTPNNDYSERIVKTFYQLAQRKGGKVFYEDPNASLTANATSGHRRTYTLFHFQHAGEIVSTQVSSEAKCPTDIVIDVNTISRFTDM